MFYKKLIINGTEYKLAVNISGNGAPTEEGSAGMIYMDEDTGDTYKFVPSLGWVLMGEFFEKVTTGADMELYDTPAGFVLRAYIYPTDGNGEIFIPIGWKALICYVIDPATGTVETVSATDSDITKKITFSGEQYILIYISRLDGLSPDKNDCPVTITKRIPITDEIIAIEKAVAALKTETWTFTLEDGSTVTKAVYVG